MANHARSFSVRSFLLAALAAATIASAPIPAFTADQQGAWPLRPEAVELKDFVVCELDRKTGEQADEECVPAAVPGDVFTALMRAGRIEDPYHDFNSNSVQWVDNSDWKYQTSFEYSARPGKRLHILFMGLDYISRIELNGEVLVPRHEGMFSRVDLDISDSLDPSGHQELAVIFAGIPNSKLEGLLGGISTEFGRRKYLKTQMSFDWDFAPRLKGCGIWDRVYLYETGSVSIRDVFVKTRLDGRVEVSVEASGGPAEGAEIEVEIQGDNFRSKKIMKRVPLSGGAAAIELTIPDPKLWWPWDMGAQDLYRARVALKAGGVEMDKAEEVFGIREIAWGPNPDAPPGSADWVLFINGKREFIRGANWVPAEAMYGRMTDDRYGRLISMAKDVGANCLRIWGGGNRERRAFYDFCDRAGVMVWQEFPFACVYLVGYPRGRDFREVVSQEASEMVRQLRNHPSLIMWCGGNEFNVVRNGHVIDILTETTGALDPTRRFIPASPYKGDSHNWVVWHMQGNLDDYFDDISPVPSEFGLQAYPAPQTLKKWLSPQYLWPINDAHAHHDLGPEKMEKYASVIGYEDSLESYARATQLMQAHFLQRGIENWRQRKYATSGTAFWQLNEPWPAICWSVIDYELEPKLSYQTLRNSYRPLLITARFQDRKYRPGDAVNAEVMVVNDFHREYRDLKAVARICGEPAGSWTGVAVPGDGVVSVGRVEAVVPDGCEEPTMRLGLYQGKELISENEYRLWIHDPTPAGRVNRGLTKAGMMLMSGAAQNQWKKE